MKKFQLLSLFMAMTLFAACSDDDNNTPTPPLPDNVYQVEGTVCEITDNSDATVTIIMKAAKFASKMPAMDIYLPNIPCFVEGGNKQLLAHTVIPEVMFVGIMGPYENYTINNFSGRITAEGELAFQGYMHLGKIEFKGNKEGNAYKGTTTTTYPDGEAPTDVPVVDAQVYENTTSTATVEENKATVTLNNISFAQGMPAMNIRIADIPQADDNSYYSPVVIPTVSMRGSEYTPMERYTMTDVACNITDESLQLTLKFPMGYLRYTATATAEGYTGTMSFTKITE